MMRMVRVQMGGLEELVKSWVSLSRAEKQHQAEEVERRETHRELWYLYVTIWE
jgi:hypothetical protein